MRLSVEDHYLALKTERKKIFVEIHEIFYQINYSVVVYGIKTFFIFKKNTKLKMLNSIHTMGISDHSASLSIIVQNIKKNKVKFRNLKNKRKKGEINILIKWSLMWIAAPFQQKKRDDDILILAENSKSLLFWQLIKIVSKECDS